MIDAVWLNEPLVPVTVTVGIWADANVHVSVADPEPVTLVGETLQAVLSAERLTIPLNPLTAAITIVEVPAEPALT